ncbi:hypothetical protein B0T17DRAFT_541680 [Bombardia bombarda]|uniref:Rhodopsin domain-containing protein n=1 Tax=Bombardia bombarda TaxID=252184 RepID=A0AA39WH82_9PEZI|nr:hypothetical protein B0T17DRAFT_541680 [Bombardia bombarda]
MADAGGKDLNYLPNLLGIYDNLNDPVPGWNRRETILGVTITFMLLSWGCAIARLYVRFFVIRAPGWDDAFLLTYLASTTLGSIMCCILPDWGFGQHFLTLKPDILMGYLKRLWLANAAYTMSTALIKISLLFQYLRVFDKGVKRHICILTMVLIALWGTGYSILAWVPCVPVAAFWDFTITEKSCYGYGSTNVREFLGVYQSHVAVNMIFDIIVFTLPIPLYFKKNTPTKTKLGLILLGALGAFVIVLSAWRLASIVENKSTTYPTFDSTFYGPVGVLLGVMEVDLASICASVPVFWPLIRAHMGEIFVTKEIEITHEDRSNYFELRRGRSGERSITGGGNGDDSPEGSEICFRGVGGGGGIGAVTQIGRAKVKDPATHYQDEYVQQRVNPFAGGRGETGTPGSGMEKEGVVVTMPIEMQVPRNDSPRLGGGGGGKPKSLKTMFVTTPPMKDGNGYPGEDNRV